MTKDTFNNLLHQLRQSPGRENVLKTAFALVEWMGMKQPKEGRERLLAPKKQELKKYLVPHALTNQHQFYRLTEENEPITVRFAVIKKIRKDQLVQLIDKEDKVDFQSAPVIIQNGRTAPAYFVHIVTTPAYDRLYFILNQGNQKRILSLRNKLTQTQFNKIIPAWQNVGALSKPELAKLLWTSLDIGEVNKEFYEKIKTRFDDLAAIIKLQSPESNDNQIKQYAVRLIGRYIFCWFLKEKEIIPEKLISSETIANHQESFFQVYLQHLFFNTLNEEVQSRSGLKDMQSPLTALYENIPYLNGGLFDENHDDGLFGNLDLNAWVLSFVKVLESFDFTVDESSSQYQQVAIDPEMLGRILENLLASQNPETEKMANQRKALGAFYTPREIVDYMVNESLKAYVEQALLPETPSETIAENVLAEPAVAYRPSLFADIEPRQTVMTFNPAKEAETKQKRERLQTKIDKLFAPATAENPFDKNETPLVKDILQRVTILDPACGSGAFPMGVLLRLMELRELVGSSLNSRYQLKSEILSRNIYGVDILPIAVEIARLRAWLSLILEADYKPTDRMHNFGIAALPNLDFKFVCANSLIDSGYDEFLKKVDHNATLARMDGEIQRLERIKENYYDPKGDKHRKEHLQTEFNQTKNYIKTEFASLKKNWKLEDFFNKVDDWDPFDDSRPSSFFSPGWMFGIRHGFDIVIGNPPYIQMQKNQGKLANELKNSNYKTFERTGDVYAIFYEFGFNVLKEGGVHCFITSSQWLKAGYGKSLRKLFLSKNPLRLIALGPDVFESAVVDTNILIAKNEHNRNELTGSVVDKPEQLNHLADLPFQTMPYVTVEQWAIMGDGKRSVNEKIRQKGKPLSDWNVKINFGIKTGLNEAFIIDDVKRQELIKEDTRSEEIIRPILKGREIEKYLTKWDGDYLINSHNGVKAKKIKGVDIEKYSAIKKHFDSFSENITKRLDQGDTPYNLRNCAYLDEFNNEKIIWKRIGSQLRFSYSDSEIYCLDSTCIATGEKIKYLTALLNSKLCNYQLFENAPRTGMGDLIISVQALEPLLVYYPTEKQEEQITAIVDKIIQAKQLNASSDTSQWEKEIDIIVYQLYDLTFDEAKIFDKTLTAEDFEKYRN